MIDEKEQQTVIFKDTGTAGLSTVFKGMGIYRFYEYIPCNAFCFDVVDL